MYIQDPYLELVEGNFLYVVCNSSILCLPLVVVMTTSRVLGTSRAKPASTNGYSRHEFNQVNQIPDPSFPFYTDTAIIFLQCYKHS